MKYRTKPVSEPALPPGITPPRRERPAGYQFGLDQRVKVADGSPMLDAIRDGRR